MIKCKIGIRTNQNVIHKSVYMYHSLVELIYEEIERANWIVIRNDENTWTFSKLKC